MHRSPYLGIVVAVLAVVTSACVTVSPLSGPTQSPLASGGLPSFGPVTTPVPATALATLAPTQSPTQSPTQAPPPTEAPTEAPTDTPTAPPTDTPTAPPTDPPTEPPTTEPTPVPTLNFTLPAVYGSTALSSGFQPDPLTGDFTAGGPVGVSYLGGGCSGYTTSAPSFSVNYTSGSAPLLRFYFIAAVDTTMIVNTPGGTYVCVDDSFGTLHPTIDFNSPSAGRYDIWIGTFAVGESVDGTLYVTEIADNHPEP